MKIKLKSFFGTASFIVIFVSFVLSGCNSNAEKPQAFTKPTYDDIQHASNPVRWQMVWVDNFGISEITNPRLEAQLETFISGVSITTKEVQGRLITFKAGTGCWGMTYELRRRIITPAQTKEKIQQDGGVEYEVIPATYKPYVDVVSVGGACTYHPTIDGKVYNLNWFEPMEDFISLNFQKAENRIDGNMLKWVGPNGKILARFEKIPTQRK